MLRTNLVLALALATVPRCATQADDLQVHRPGRKGRIPQQRLPVRNDGRTLDMQLAAGR
jgi:hypothetical protein